MISGDGRFIVRKAELDDLGPIKALADAHRHELGFVMRPALVRSIERNELLVAVDDTYVIGFLEYHHRRDSQTTLYHIAVSKKLRQLGIGRMLMEALRREALSVGKEVIRLKCPEALPANEFYERLGAQRIVVEEGKDRALVVWEFPLNRQPSP